MESETHYDCTTFTLIFIQRRHKLVKYYNKCMYDFCNNNSCSYILCIMFVSKIKIERYGNSVYIWKNCNREEFYRP